MNDANISNITTNDLHNPEMPLDNNAGRTALRSRLQLSSRTVYLPTFKPHANWQVREDKGVYIPDLLSDAEYDANPEAYAAFADHANHLHKTEGLLDEAWNLVRLMLASLGDEGDSRAMQIEAGLKVIEKKLSKAHKRIDKHHTRYTNLFLAYFDLKDEADGRAE